MPFATGPLSLAGLLLAGLLVGTVPSGAERPPASEVHRDARSVTVDPGPAPARGVWPLQPAPPVVAAFAPPAQRWSAGHRGVDLLGRPGRPVHAALAGTVSYVGRIAGRGIVTVDHGRVRTTYQPVAAVVGRGEVVTTGQVIGRLLLSGSHCAPRACLHWGLIRGQTYLDPLTLVGAGPQPVRLYPW